MDLSLATKVIKPWFDAEEGPVRQLWINRTWVSNEIQTNMGENGQITYVIANKNAKNQWGYPRAYRFQPGLHAVHDVSIARSKSITATDALLDPPGVMRA